MNAYIFVAAVLASVIPFVVIINMSVKKMIENPNDSLKIQKQFFLAVAASKITPVFLLIVGIVKITYIEDISVLYVPWLIIIVTVVFGIFFITKLKQLPENDDAKLAVNTLVSIARPLLFSIPFMAIAFTLLMLS